MSLIPFPDVPDLPGVPMIPRSPNFPATVQAGLGLLQGTLWNVLQVQQSQWGIYDSTGRPLGNPSQITGITAGIVSAIGLNPFVPTLSTDSVSYSKETLVSDFPVEQGGFATYNKVERPGVASVTLCFMGSEGDRTAFLDAIDLACISTDPYTVLTPETAYVGYSIERYNYQRRSGKGATLLIIELSLKEIRVVTAKYTVSTPKDPSTKPAEDAGKIQAKAPNESILKGLYNWAANGGAVDSFKALFRGTTP